MTLDDTRCPAGYVHHSWRDVTGAWWPWDVLHARQCAACHLCEVTLRPAVYRMDTELRITRVEEE